MRFFLSAIYYFEVLIEKETKLKFYDKPKWGHLI